MRCKPSCRRRARSPVAGCTSCREAHARVQRHETSGPRRARTRGAGAAARNGKRPSTPPLPGKSGPWIATKRSSRPKKLPSKSAPSCRDVPKVPEPHKGETITIETHTEGSRLWTVAGWGATVLRRGRSLRRIHAPAVARIRRRSRPPGSAPPQRPGAAPSLPTPARPLQDKSTMTHIALPSRTLHKLVPSLFETLTPAVTLSLSKGAPESRLTRRSYR